MVPAKIEATPADSGTGPQNPAAPRAIHKMKRYGDHRYPGRLFIVQGIDGSGKSTQLMLLHQWLRSEGYGVVFSEWNSSMVVKDTTKRGKKRKMLTPASFCL